MSIYDKIFSFIRKRLIVLVKKDEYMEISKDFSRITDTKSIRVIS